MLRISLLTNCDTSDWSVGKEILDAFSGDLRLVPETLFQWETKIAEYESVSGCKPYWAQVAKIQAQGTKIEIPIGLRWKRKKVAKYECEVSHTHTSIKGELISGSVNVRAQFNSKVDWFELFSKLCIATRPKYAMLHIFSGSELEGIKAGTPESLFLSGVLQSGKISNASWSMFLGTEFLVGLDIDVLRGNGFFVDELDGGCIIRITDDIQDVINDFSSFSKCRADLKSVFQDGFFLMD